MIPTNFPNFNECQIWLDFDGTITREDILDLLIQRFSIDDSWREIENLWQSGKIGSRECLSGELALLRVDDHKLKKTLDFIRIDNGIFNLLKLLKSLMVPVAILSDNAESIIQHILDRHDIQGIPVRGNALIHRGDKLAFSFPNGSHECETDAAHCKCSSINTLKTPGLFSIYIGDGMSDVCPARKMDYVFAKKSLASVMSRESRPFIPYDTLDEVTEFLFYSWMARAEKTKAQR